MKEILLATVLAVLVVSRCSQPTEPNEIPDWLKALTAKYQNEPVGNPPQSIWRYEYKGKIVYYVPPQCCDQFCFLYDSQGNILCAPCGGITGRGDGTCSDFFTDRKNERLVWKDPRTQ